jgi:hypothetical protein
MRNRARVLIVVAVVFNAATISDCGGRLDDDADADASIHDAAGESPLVDGPYIGQCCNIDDGSTAGPCDHDASDYGFTDLGDGDTYFCGYDIYTINLDGGVGDWRHCAYQSGHRWVCCVPADPTCCPKIAEADDAGNPPAKPGSCNGIEPADGF